jgi:hypothetical protein
MKITNKVKGVAIVIAAFIIGSWLGMTNEELLPIAGVIGFFGGFFGAAVFCKKDER